MTQRKRWTPEEVQTLKRLYPTSTAEAVAQTLAKTLAAIYQKARLLGLRKAPEFFETGESGRLDGVRGGSTRFKPGHKTWNKGTRYVAGGRSAETRFKKGQAPHNAVEVGAYRITKDGTLQRKIGTAKGSNSKRWRGVHELVWVEANGPMPPGHICVFKPGMRTAVLEEITADKVECISFAENMRRNTLHRYPKQIAQLIQLRGALNRKINRRTKHEQDDRRSA